MQNLPELCRYSPLEYVFRAGHQVCWSVVVNWIESESSKGIPVKSALIIKVPAAEAVKTPMLVIVLVPLATIVATWLVRVGGGLGLRGGNP